MYFYRRYNDFVKLDEQLRLDYPDLDFDLPPKKWLGDNFDPVFLGRRISGLSKYLQRIMKHTLGWSISRILARDEKLIARSSLARN